jgi:phage tail-like protein
MSLFDFDPWGNYYFALEIDGVELAHFSEISGLKSSANVFEIEEGGLNGQVHRLVGQSKWENIVLKQATNVGTELVAWRDKYVTDEGWGDRPDSSGAIIVKNNMGLEVRRYIFTACWPVSWEGPQLNSGGSDLAIETLEIAFDQLYIDSKPPPEPDNPKPPPPAQFETEPVQFELDSAELTPEGEETMAELNESIAETDVQEIWVEGHTCWLGPGGAGSSQSHAYNQTLSAERAATCAASIKESNPSVIVHSAGFSFDHPKASNRTASGRSTNRRTEFWTEPRGGLRAGELE